MKVPWKDIPSETLDNMIEEFVTRDGTDYGEVEISVTRRVEQVKKALRDGELVIWFDQDSESISFLDKEQVRQIDV